MTTCETIIRKRIQENGSISITDYMKIALLHPKQGFYRTHQPIGSLGHFMTSPEISQVFGELIGVWTINRWLEMGRPKKLSLVELGPGRGTMMNDLLRVSKAYPSFLKSIHIYFVEINSILSKIQKENLKNYTNIIQNCKTINEALRLLTKSPAIFIANEYFDALPIRQFERVTNGWKERHVAIRPYLEESSKTELYFTTKYTNEFVSHLDNKVRVGTIIENCPIAEENIDKICYFLNEFGGAALVIDYGHTGQVGDTLQAVMNNASCSPTKNIGRIDLTAHVNFLALEKIVRSYSNLSSLLTTQLAFLTSLHIHTRLAILLKKADRDQRSSLLSEVSRLTSPLYMGTLFKVLDIKSSDM